VATRILMVCLGNICRSPMAQGVMERQAAAAGLGVEVDSAGVGGWHEGEGPDRRAVAAARARGLDISAQRARQVRGGDFERFDLILAMDESNLAALERARPASARARLALLLDHAEGPEREVPDPYYGGAQGFDRVLDLIEAGVAGVLAGLRR
jgi:protein-tyrosine phosphatase